MKSSVCFLALTALLAGCNSGSVKDTLGLNRSAPDAFRVVSRPPLSVPPEFSLQPPTPGQPSLRSSTQEIARDSILTPREGKPSLDGYVPSTVPSAVIPVEATNAPTTGEAVFYSKLGVQRADPTIRNQLYQDQTQGAVTEKEEGSPLERWLGIANEDASTVDAAQEAARIRANKEAGRPVTEGEIPTQDQQNDGLLNKLFD